MADGERNSLAALSTLAKSRRLWQWVGGLVLAGAGLLFTRVVSWIEGWDASLSRVGQVSALTLRVETHDNWIDDAGVALDEVAGTRALLEAEIRDSEEREIAVWRAIVLSNATPARASAALKEYERLVAQRIKPAIAADITLGWSRPPGR